MENTSLKTHTQKYLPPLNYEPYDRYLRTASVTRRVGHHWPDFVFSEAFNEDEHFLSAVSAVARNPTVRIVQ